MHLRKHNPHQHPFLELVPPSVWRAWALLLFFFPSLMSWCCSKFLGFHSSFHSFTQLGQRKFLTTDCPQGTKGWGLLKFPASDGPAPKLEVYRKFPLTKFSPPKLSPRKIPPFPVCLEAGAAHFYAIATLPSQVAGQVCTPICLMHILPVPRKSRKCSFFRKS